MSQATRLITASEDDESPIIMLWDLRNTRAPERVSHAGLRRANEADLERGMSREFSRLRGVGKTQTCCCLVARTIEPYAGILKAARSSERWAICRHR